MAGYADFITEKVKGLFSHENKPFCVPFGGDKRDRTADLLNAIQALSQLSYTPIYFQKRNFIGYAIFDCRIVVTQWGHTFNLLGSQLSYTPMFNFCCFADRTNCILAEYYPFVNYFFVFLPIEREFFVIWELSAIVDYYKQA